MQTFNYLMLLTSELATNFDWVTSTVIPIITSLLSSCLLVGIIEFVKWKMDIKIANITHERKEWRKELREIASRLGDDNEPLTKILIDLKVRINTLGIKTKEYNLVLTEDRERYFSKDSYIWYLIEEIEKKINTNLLNDELLKSYKKKLVELISLLLKYDWDRSKEEIEAKSEKKYELSLIVLTIICLLIIAYPVFYVKADLCISILMFVIVICVPLIVSLLTYIFSKKSKNDDKLKKFLIKDSSSFIILMFLLIVGFILLFFLFYYLHQNNINYWLFDSFFGFATIFIFLYSMVLLCYLIMSIKIKKHENIKYTENEKNDIIKIDNKYSDIMTYIFKQETSETECDSNEKSE